MQDFTGKVAVVTGAASGIGRALATRFAQEGCKVVLADIAEGPLRIVEAGLKEKGTQTRAVVTDVTKPHEVQALADAALDAFGEIHVVCNNAGVALAPSSGVHVWDTPIEEYEWVLGVNLWGVIHGCRVFTPILLRQDQEAHIINTASIAGLLARHTTHVYTMTKHAVLSLTESLYLQMERTNPKIGVSALCPGFVSTDLSTSDRNAPAAVKRLAGSESAEHQELRRRFAHVLGGGIPPDRVAELAVAAIRERRLYVLAHPEYNRLVQLRIDDVVNGRNLDAYSAAYDEFARWQAEQAAKREQRG